MEENEPFEEWKIEGLWFYMVKKLFLTVIWPRFEPPDIFETKFSYKICKRISKSNIEKIVGSVDWIDYFQESTVKEILPKIKGRHVLAVFDPEIAVSEDSIRRLTQSIDSGIGVCGPVYNDTMYLDQLAEIPFMYYTPGTFEEVSKILDQKIPDGIVKSEGLLDPGCISCEYRKLAEIDEDRLILNLYQFISGPRYIDKGALVHRFTKGFESEREDLIHLVPESAKKVLDVGCAMGMYGKKLKEKRPGIKVYGVELNPVMARSAEKHYDKCFRGAIEDFDFQSDFDLINCGDILEHLYDPWEILKRFNRSTTLGGHLVLSVPNAGHWAIVLDLIHGKFDYIPLGLQCVSHIRWFTEKSLESLLKEAGYEIEVIQHQKNIPTPEGRRFINDIISMGYGDEDGLMTNEMLVRARVKERLDSVVWK